MKTYRTSASTLLIAAILSGCASPGYYPPATSKPYPAPRQTYPSSMYGTVDSIQLQQGTGGNGIGVGTVVGGVVGGLLGNQVGGGNGKKAATVAGAIGGAMVGHQIEQRNAQVRDAYQIGVRLDNGGYQTVTQDSTADLYVGSRVRIENGRVYRY